jgi:pilus assembly protein Flp/PilA
MLSAHVLTDPYERRESAVASLDHHLGRISMLQLMQRLVNRRDEEKGASAVEYGLLVAAIAAIIVLIVFAIGKFVQSGFKNTCAAMDAEMTTVAATC